MEFIIVEQFKKQPVEVQEVFLDWWCWENEYISDYDLIQDGNQIMLYKDYLERGCIENDSYPLFTEGQLRKFIEDKAKCKVMIEYTSCENIVIKICTQDEVTGALRCNRKLTFPNDKFDLINSYWKVACILAEEEIDASYI